MITSQINGKTQIYGIIGNPVSHSFSPAMQTLAFQSLGINSVYLPFPVEVKNLAALLQSFELLGIQGFNVTVPHKENIVPLLSSLSKAAQFLGAVNTVCKTPEGWKGYNTDGSGFVRSLLEKGYSLSNKKVLLLGAGGSAKSVAFSLLQSKIQSLTIYNRTESKAKSLSQKLQIHAPQLPILSKIDPQEEFDFLINCTSVGMFNDSLPVSEKTILQCKIAVDIIYNPPQTALLKIAKKHGMTTLNGLGMLLFQGVEAFEIWTGKKAPIDLMQRSLLDSLHPPKSVK